jgi:hypothetical protein
MSFTEKLLNALLGFNMLHSLVIGVLVFDAKVEFGWLRNRLFRRNARVDAADGLILLYPRMANIVTNKVFPRCVIQERGSYASKACVASCANRGGIDFRGWKLSVGYVLLATAWRGDDHEYLRHHGNLLAALGA